MDFKGRGVICLVTIVAGSLIGYLLGGLVGALFLAFVGYHVGSGLFYQNELDTYARMYLNQVEAEARRRDEAYAKVSDEEFDASLDLSNWAAFKNKADPIYCERRDSLAFFGLPPEADMRALKRAYYAKMNMHHPDKKAAQSSAACADKEKAQAQSIQSQYQRAKAAIKLSFNKSIAYRPFQDVR